MFDFLEKLMLIYIKDSKLLLHSKKFKSVDLAYTYDQSLLMVPFPT